MPSSPVRSWGDSSTGTAAITWQTQQDKLLVFILFHARASLQPTPTPQPIKCVTLPCCQGPLPLHTPLASSSVADSRAPS
jgi:hypothetical protein